MKVGILGLGEAGGRIAADLVAAGCEVRGWDPARRLDGVPSATDACDAAREADVVVSVNAAAVAVGVAREVASALPAGSIYADFNTAAPALKRELAGTRRCAVRRRCADRDRSGHRALAPARSPQVLPQRRFAELFGPLGMPIEVVGTEPGDAAAIKLLRSVFMKGLAAASLETLAGAKAAGVEDRLHADLVEVIGEPLLERLLTGSKVHAVRRADEMRAAAANLEELGVEPRVARAAAEWFDELRS